MMLHLFPDEMLKVALSSDIYHRFKVSTKGRRSRWFYLYYICLKQRFLCNVSLCLKTTTCFECCQPNNKNTFARNVLPDALANESSSEASSKKGTLQSKLKECNQQRINVTLDEQRAFTGNGAHFQERPSKWFCFHTVHFHFFSSGNEQNLTFWVFQSDTTLNQKLTKNLCFIFRVSSIFHWCVIH